MLYKTVGALMLLCSGLWCARLLNARAEAALRQAEGMLSLLRAVKLRIDCYAESLPRILAALPQQMLADCGCFGDCPPQNFEELLARCALLDGESVAILSEFSAGFGRGYREEQVRACGYAIAQMETRRDALLRSLPSEKKRNVTLCLTCSLGLAILLF